MSSETSDGCDFRSSRRMSPWILLALLNCALLAALFWKGQWLITTDGKVFPHDYLAQWAAGRRVVMGDGSQVYDWVVHAQFQGDLIGRSEAVALYLLYPPHFLFLTPVFAGLAYLPASLAFLATSIALYAASLRLFVASWWRAAVISIAGGGAFYSLWWVQNGFLFSAVLVAGIVLLRKNPILAGICFGLLTMKPQLGLLIPIALVASRNWRAFISAVLTFFTLAVGAEMLLGTGIWMEFVRSLGDAGAFLESGNLWFKQQSAFALAYPFLGPEAAWIVQAMLALLLGVIIFDLWRKSNDFWVRSASLIAGSLLATPYLYTYDAVCLSAAAYMLIYRQQVRPLRFWEMGVVYVGCLIPILTRFLYSSATPLGAVMILYIGVRLAAQTADRPRHAISSA